ncbi:MAG TPA: type II toxin-antitoxin system VapB family antitoxin [Steroidobacteraceae bacterium]|nr:type II toxin-antitoxin system VapB family antitoxin [Steroidobacteraceae bacterium]
MFKTRLFKNGNSQAVRIPAEIAYPEMDADLEIERDGDELRIRPVRRSLADALRNLPTASPDFMADGRGEQAQVDREPL